MDYNFIAGDTDKTIYLRLRDSSTGLAQTGLVFDSAGAVCSFTLPLALRAAIALVTNTVDGAHTDGGFVEVDATNAKGLYRLDLPDAAIASGDFSIISIEFDGIIEESVQIELHTRKVNVTQISDDSVAADNLELMFDGTGYIDTTAPSSRAQVDAIGATTGGALNFANEADNVDAPLQGITFDGVETSGTNADANTENAIWHQIDDVANNIDIVYRFDVGGGRTAVEVSWRGRLTGGNDEFTIQAFNGSSFDTIAVVTGQSNSAPTSTSDNALVVVPLLSTHTGTGVDLGKVFIRLECAGQSNPTIYTDQLIVSAVNIGQSVGYALGRIWIDTVGGTAGTEAFVNGTADNPVLTLADALTLSTSVGITDFHLINGSSITFAANSDNQSYFGDNWTLALGGQSTVSTHISGATVSGIQTGSGLETEDGAIDTSTFDDDTHILGAGLMGTITLPVGDVFFDACHMGAAGGPTFDFGAAVANTTLHIHHYAGLLTIANLGQDGTDVVNLDGDGRLDIAASCTGGTINIRGMWEIVDSSGGAVTIVKDDTTTDVDAILVDTGTTIPALLPAALVSGRMDSNVSAIDNSNPAAVNLKQSSLAVQAITVQTAEGDANTDTIFDTDLPTEAADYYGSGQGGLVVAFISGAAQQFQTRRIIASATVTLNTRITLEEALDGTPADSDVCVVLGRITELT